MGMTGAAEVLPGRAAARAAAGRSRGVRLALVQVWATATIAALVAGPGLGRVITDGFFRTNYGKGIAGAVVVGVVALVLELLAAAVQRLVAPVRNGSSPNRDSAVSVASTVLAADLGRRLDVQQASPSSCTSGHAWPPGHGTQKVTPCTSRRSLAAVLSVGTLFLATAVPVTTSTRARTTPTTAPRRRDLRVRRTSAAGRSTCGPELPRGRAGRRDVPAAPRERRLRRRRPSWSTPATATWPTFPGSVDIVPEYVGGIVNFLNSQKNGADADAVRGRRRRRSSPTTARRCSTRRASPCSTCRRRPTPTRSSSPRSTPRPTASPSSPTSRASRQARGRPRLRGPARLRGRPHRRSTASTSPRCCRSATPATRPTSRCSTASRSSARPAPPTAPWRPRAWCCSRTTSRSSRPRTSCRPSSTEFLGEHPDVADILNPLMAALTTENLTELNGRVAVDREKPEDVARTSSPRTACSKTLGRVGPGITAYARCARSASQSRWPPGPITRRARFARRSLRSSIEMASR